MNQPDAQNSLDYFVVEPPTSRTPNTTPTMADAFGDLFVAWACLADTLEKPTQIHWKSGARFRYNLMVDNILDREHKRNSLIFKRRNTEPTSQAESPLNRLPRWWRRLPWRKDRDSLSLPEVEQPPQVSSAPPPQVVQSPPLATRRNNARPNRPLLDKASHYWFGTHKVSREVALALKAIAYEEPTRIQSECIGPLLAGNDVVGQAHTGTGKTAAFGIPLVDLTNPSEVCIQGLILVPTRELAMQVRDEIVRLAQFSQLGVVACYGGQPISKQIAALKRRTHIVVGTPGRVLDHLGKGTLRLEAVRTVILDEADEMLDIGFLPDIERILGRTPRHRQTALFSATMPSPIRRIVGRHMRSPVWIQIGNEIETAPDVRQVYFEVLEQDRVHACVRLLKTQMNGGKVLVFRKTKVGVDNLAQALQRQGIAAAGIHGGLLQSERNAAMRSFHAGERKVLVATNVAARGLDIPQISHVVNYDMPQNLEEYVHRIGRTARMGRDGTAITFVTEWDFPMLDLLQDGLAGELKQETLPL